MSMLMGALAGAANAVGEIADNNQKRWDTEAIDRRRNELEIEKAKVLSEFGFGQRAAERQQVFDEGVRNAPTVRAMAVDDERAKLGVQMDPALLKQRADAKVAEQIAAERAKLQFQTQNRGEIVAGLQAQTDAKETDADRALKQAQIKHYGDSAEAARAKATADGKMTEDQGKATGWLVQAGNAHKNMMEVMEKNPEAARPGFNDVLGAAPGMEGVANSMRGSDRQKYLQGASSLSEALLRAATGAGMNENEAKQKIKEVTPQIGDEDAVVKQKMDALPLYLDSLRVRAGPGAAKADAILEKHQVGSASSLQSKSNVSATTGKTFKDYGYDSSAAVIQDAKNTLLKNPQARPEIERRLAAIGLSLNGGN